MSDKYDDLRELAANRDWWHSRELASLLADNDAMRVRLDDCAAYLISAREELKSGGWHFPMALLDKAILRAQQGGEPKPQAVVPDGYVMVPIEPTEEMVRAACIDSHYPAALQAPIVKRVYRDMLSAAKGGEQE